MSKITPCKPLILIKNLRTKRYSRLQPSVLSKPSKLSLSMQYFRVRLISIAILVKETY